MQSEYLGNFTEMKVIFKNKDGNVHNAHLRDVAYFYFLNSLQLQSGYIPQLSNVRLMTNNITFHRPPFSWLLRTRAN